MFQQFEANNKLKDNNQLTLAEHLGIEITEYGDGYIKGKMPVDDRTRQPFGLLHGGASAAFAETLGSVASFYLLPEGKQVVGLEINANHLRGVRDGYVYGEVRPLHVGRTTHVWEIKITNVEGKLVCVSRLTCMIV